LKKFFLKLEKNALIFLKKREKGVNTRLEGVNSGVNALR
jgi:hypothetical protein